MKEHYHYIDLESSKEKQSLVFLISPKSTQNDNYVLASIRDLEGYAYEEKRLLELGISDVDRVWHPTNVVIVSEGKYIWHVEKEKYIPYVTVEELDNMFNLRTS